MGSFFRPGFVRRELSRQTRLPERSNQRLVKSVLGIFQRQVFSFPAAGAFQPGVVSRAGLTLLEVRTSYLAGPLRLTPVRFETDMFQISACLLPVSRVADFPVRSVQHRTTAPLSVSLSWLTLKWIARTARPRSRLTQLPE